MESDEVIGATVAVYPLYTESDMVVRQAIDSLASTGFDADVGPMNTLVTGTAEMCSGRSGSPMKQPPRSTMW